MSKVISFSISDRYLDKLRSLYPSLTDNLAVKQFVTDGLDSNLGNSLDVSLDDRLDDRVKTLIESWVDGLLDERLDATVGKLITSLSERLSRLEERLDDSLDGRLDDMERLLRLQQSASIASPIPTDETVRPVIKELPTDETVEPISSSPPVKEAIEDSEKKIPLPDISIASPIGIDETVSTDSSIKSATDAIETDDREWLTLQQIADKKIKGLPGTQQGLRLHAKNWESRKNPQKRGEQYKIPKEYL